MSEDNCKQLYEDHPELFDNKDWCHYGNEHPDDSSLLRGVVVDEKTYLVCDLVGNIIEINICKEEKK